MGCCVLQVPAVPEIPASTSPSSERSLSFSVLVCQTELLSPEPKSVPRGVASQHADDQLLETSLQTLQVRLDV